ncbi:co-chaperone GroES [bacterium]|nr:co-chaperone GroES [bacterium]
MATATKKKVGIRPLSDRVLIKPLEEGEDRVGSLYIPDTAKEKPMQGTVVAIGTGKLDDAGKLIPFSVKAGDKVLYGKYSGTEVKLDGDEYLMMRESDLLAIIS